jgi:ankyrin repeat protein
MIQDVGHSGEHIELDNVFLQNSSQRSTTENLATSLVQRGYADIEWLRSTIKDQPHVDIRDKDGKSLLQLLLEIPWTQKQKSDQEEGIKLLIDKGAELDWRDTTGQTALHVAVKHRLPKQIVEILIENSADVDTIDSDKKTPLYVLLEGSGSFDLDLLRLLLEAGADLFYNLYDDTCQLECPLHLLLNSTDTLIENLSLCRQICPKDGTRMVKSLLYQAVHRKDASTLELLMKDIDSLDTFCDPGELLLAAAQAPQDAETKVDLLLQYGTDPNSTTQSGMGLAHAASLQGSLRVLQKASTNLESSIDRKDTNGDAPLHYVASSLSRDPEVMDCVKYLVSLGANVDAHNNRGWTPLDTALKFKKKSIVIELVRAGASLPHRRVASTLATDQLSILVELDVIAASKKPVITALKTAGLMQNIQVIDYDTDENYYSEMAQNLEKIAAQMLKFKLEGVSEVTDEVLLTAVENSQKQFVSENAVQAYVRRRWYGENTGLMKSTLRCLITVLYWSVLFHFLPFAILFYALFRYRSRSRIFLDNMKKRISPAIQYFVAGFCQAGFIILILYDSATTEGLRINIDGKLSSTDLLVFYFVISYALHEVGQLLIKGPFIYFSSWRNVLDVFIVFLFAISSLTRIVDSFSVHRFKDAVPYRTTASLANALASFLFIIRFIGFLAILPTVGTIIISFKQIIRDILSFLFLWGLLLLAFSIVMSLVYPVAAYRHYRFVEGCIESIMQNDSSNATASRAVIRSCVLDLYRQVVPEKVQGSDTIRYVFFHKVCINQFTLDLQKLATH